MRDVTGHLEWTLGWGWAPRVGLFVVALAILVLAWLNVRHLASAGQRAALLALRGALVVCLLLVALQPTWVQERQRERERVIAVIVDDSRSMRQPGRRERAAGWAALLQAKPQVRLYAAGSHLRAIEDGKALRAQDADTDLVGALRELVEGADPSTLAAVVVISDGIDPRLKGGLTAEAREVLASLAVPVHTLALPDPAPLTDVAVEAIRASPFAFARDRLPVEVDVIVDGLAGRSGHITIRAALDGVPVASRRLPLSGPRKRTVELEIQPKTLGDHVLTVAATRLPGEVTHVNNRRHQPLRVIRDRVRILHLAGHPSYDTRFLRAHLRADPSVDLISFYIMVGRGGGVFVEAGETTLIPFPTPQLFGPALDDFDLIVFSDFDFARFGIERFLPQTRKWVESGGAFAVFGGPDALAAGGYGRSSLARWLPVRLDSAQHEQAWRPGAFSPTRTAIGRQHAITRLHDDDGRNDALWQTLRLEGFNQGGAAHDDAAVLLQGPGGAPLLAITELGEGRVAVMGTNSLWTWAFPDGDTRERDAVRAAYQRLVGRLRGWLLRDPAFAPMQVQVDGGVLLPHRPVAIDVRVVATNPRAATGVRLRLWATPLPTTPPTTAAPPGPSRRIAGVATTDATGRARLSWRPPRGGPWRLTVAGEVRGQRREVKLAVAVADARDEDLHLLAAGERLAALATHTGGAQWSTPPEHIPTAPDRGPVLRERRRVEVWSSAWVAAALFLLLVGEWVLRRRWGLA